VGPRVGVEGCRKSRPEIPSPDRPAHSVVAIPTELSRPTMFWAHTACGVPRNFWGGGGVYVRKFFGGGGRFNKFSSGERQREF
jgi:hypothetical protein